MRILLHTLLAAFYCCLAISSLPTQAQEIWNGEIDKNLQGTGSVSDPFLIKTANQLAIMVSFSNFRLLMEPPST